MGWDGSLIVTRTECDAMRLVGAEGRAVHAVHGRSAYTQRAFTGGAEDEDRQLDLPPLPRALRRHVSSAAVSTCVCRSVLSSGGHASPGLMD